jgi:hypothetical protein
VEIDLFVVSDNVTRWNSTYLTIQRVLKLQKRLRVFLIPTTHELEEDTLTEDDWQRLIDIERYPETFPQEGYETDSEHGSV